MLDFRQKIILIDKKIIKFFHIFTTSIYTQVQLKYTIISGHIKKRLEKYLLKYIIRFNTDNQLFVS